MASSSRQVLSPSPSVVDPSDSATPDHTSVISKAKMLNIQALLNPSVSNNSKLRRTTGSASPPPTPASTPTSTVATSQPSTPLAISSCKYQKQTKDSSAVKWKDVRGRANYPPYECGEDAVCLTFAQKHELARQHTVFKVLPYSENEQDLIADYTRHIPYSSDKKSFGGKTGRDGFDVFQYFFHTPGDSTKYTVMWDYENGLVRITPFFKACNYSKTTPAKALNTNFGLKDLAHSITGGALDAQGYWMPYSCARALCMTFCYDIRWALTPIFGPSFIHDCLKKDDPGFGRFKICAETIRNAQLETNGWETPTVKCAVEAKPIPRSAPEEATLSAGKELRPRQPRPTFNVDSPFSSDSETTYTLIDSAVDSPELSPKTCHTSPVWTSINHPRAPTTPNNACFASLENSLLNEPRYVSWRPAMSDNIAQKNQKSTSPALSDTNEKRRTAKRQRLSTKNVDPDADYTQLRDGYDAEASESESDDVEIVIQPKPKKRGRHPRQVNGTDSSTASTPRNAKARPESRKYRAEDYRAAQWLLNLSMRDADLATGPNGPVRLRK